VAYISEATRLEYNVEDTDVDAKEKYIVAAKRVWKSTRDALGVTADKRRTNNKKTRRKKRTEKLGTKLVGVLTVPTRSQATED
jgi:hypothetical protein